MPQLKQINHSASKISKKEIHEMLQFLKKNYVGSGKKSVLLESKLSELVDVKYSFAVNSGSSALNLAFKLLDLGCYISASGVVTFKKSKDLALIFQDIPNDKILVETDSPYLAPVPLRGKSNEPSFIIHTVKFLSDLKKIPFDEFSKITSNNFFKLFGKLN